MIKARDTSADPLGQKRAFVATAWNNGAWHSSGVGYGLKIAKEDRDQFFRREWEVVQLLFPGVAQPVIVNISKKSFWNEKCRELISKGIGEWLISEKLAPWSPGMPPKMTLVSDRDSGVFRVQHTPMPFDAVR